MWKEVLFDDFDAAHVRTEDFRDDDGAVFLLIVFEDGGDGSADGESRAV